MPPLTDDDRVFLADPGTWRWGPTYDLLWDLEDADRAEALMEALRSDPAIQAIPDERGRLVEETSRLAWSPGPLKPIGLTVPCDGCPPHTVHAYLYPPHLERATGRSDLGASCGPDRRVRVFFQAAVALTNRLHAQVPLVRARLFDEANWIGAGEQGSILVARWVPDTFGWPSAPAAEPDVAALPLGEDVD